MSPNDLLTPPEVAKALGVSVRTLAVWRCERRYDLRYVKVGACVRYRRRDVDAFLDERTHGSTAAERSRA